MSEWLCSAPVPGNLCISLDSVGPTKSIKPQSALRKAAKDAKKVSEYSGHDLIRESLTRKVFLMISRKSIDWTIAISPFSLTPILLEPAVCRSPAGARSKKMFW